MGGAKLSDGKGRRGSKNAYHGLFRCSEWLEGGGGQIGTGEGRKREKKRREREKEVARSAVLCLLDRYRA